MRMNLKNSSKYSNRFNIKNIKLNSKSLFIFLISFSIISLIVGFVFYYLISASDKEVINRVVENNFVVKDKYNYLKLFKEQLLSNTYNTLLIWIFGISVIGIVTNIFIYFCELFSIGFTISSIINTYSIKGVFAVIVYLIPSRLVSIIVMFILTYFSIKFSYQLIRVCFYKDEINIKKVMNKYFKVLIFSFIIMTVVSALSVFVDPFLIKLFTKL